MFDIHSVYFAIVIATRRYITENGFKKAIVGLSGGIDSALTIVIAADAIGANNIRAVLLPSQITSQRSIDDAMKITNALECDCDVVPIQDACDVIQSSISYIDSERYSNARDVVAQNIQARIRAVLLMAISNKCNEMLIATSNKSESYIGYCTLYGDTAGGFAPIKNVYKTQVYELARWRNNNVVASTMCNKVDIISDSIMTKEPSAELAMHQVDTDDIPPYDVLDRVLFGLVDNGASPEDVAKKTGIKLELVYEVNNMISRSAFKRRQSPDGPDLSIYLRDV